MRVPLSCCEYIIEAAQNSFKTCRPYLWPVLQNLSKCYVPKSVSLEWRIIPDGIRKGLVYRVELLLHTHKVTIYVRIGVKVVKLQLLDFRYVLDCGPDLNSWKGNGRQVEIFVRLVTGRDSKEYYNYLRTIRHYIGGRKGFCLLLIPTAPLALLVFMYSNDSGSLQKGKEIHGWKLTTVYIVVKLMKPATTRQDMHAMGLDILDRLWSPEFCKC